MSTYINSTMLNIFSQLDNGEELVIGDTTLLPTTVKIEGVSTNMLPHELLNLFTFRNEWAVQPNSSLSATGVVIFTTPMRLDHNGIVVPTALSVWGARRGQTKHTHPLGKPGEASVVRPDAYLQADYYGLMGTFLPVPTRMRPAYSKENEQRIPISISLTTAYDKMPDCVQQWEQAREQFSELLRLAVAEMGIAAGNHFEVCVVGFPKSVQTFSKKEDREAYLGVAFEGAYLIGVRKINPVSKELPQELEGLRVNPNTFMLNNGKSLHDMLAEEVLKLQGAPASVKPIATPTVNKPQEMWSKAGNFVVIGGHKTEVWNGKEIKWTEVKSNNLRTIYENEAGEWGILIKNKKEFGELLLSDAETFDFFKKYVRYVWTDTNYVRNVAVVTTSLVQPIATIAPITAPSTTAPAPVEAEEQPPAKMNPLANMKRATRQRPKVEIDTANLEELAGEPVIKASTDASAFGDWG